jgi:hypothetical protein
MVNVINRRSPEGNDNLFAVSIDNYLEHGWVNTNEQQMNVTSLQQALYLNTDAQVGGAISMNLLHYGKGDGVGLDMGLFCTAVNRGSDEGCEPFRVQTLPRSDNAGFAIASLATDAMGQTILRGPRGDDGRGIALPGHSALAASENALLIDLNPAKVYRAGNVQSISSCPASAGLFNQPPFVDTYICLTGDSDRPGQPGSHWDDTFHASSVTRLAAASPFSNGVNGAPSPGVCSGPQGGDQFAFGPVACRIPVVSLDGFRPGTLFAISSAEDDFEMPVALSIDATPFAAVLYGGTLPDERQALSALASVRNGGFSVTVDGRREQVAGVNLSGAASLEEVAAHLPVPGVKVTYDRAHRRFQMVSDARGAASQVYGLGAPVQDGVTDLSGLLFLSEGSGASASLGGAGVISAYLSKSHVAASLVTTGGGIGHAVSFTADDVAPGQWPPSERGGPGSTYRMAWPVIATLPGNLLVTTQFPYNQSASLGTKAFSGTRIGRLPGFKPIIEDGRWTGSDALDGGNAQMLLPPGTVRMGGLTQAPMPVMRFTGCRVEPTGHFIPVNGLGGYVPVIDTPGEGCTAATRATVQSSYRNPYEIHVAAWIRSSYDPDFDKRYPNNRNSPFRQGDFNQVITPATANYYALDGALPCSTASGFCKGDPVEQVYDQHQQQGARFNFFRPVYDVGTTGGVVEMNFRGHATPDALLEVRNLDPAVNFFGTPESHYYPDGQGHGGIVPPIGAHLGGALATGVWLDQMPARNLGEPGTVLGVFCNSLDRTAPCYHGSWWPYHLWLGDAPGGSMALNVDPNTGVLAYQPGGSFKSVHGSFPGLRTALVGETPAQTLLLGGELAGGNNGALYLLGGKDTRQTADRGSGGCVLFDDGAMHFNCGVRATLHSPAGWQFDAATPVAFAHVITAAAPPAGDKSDAVATTAWVAQALAAALQTPTHVAAPSVAGQDEQLGGNLGDGAGKGASALHFEGRPDSFAVSFTTGTGVAGGRSAVEVRFSAPHPEVRTCLVNGSNDAGAGAPVYAKAVSPAGFSLWVPAAETLPAHTAMLYAVQCR